jgi:hypothetical protein
VALPLDSLVQGHQQIKGRVLVNIIQQLNRKMLDIGHA